MRLGEEAGEGKGATVASFINGMGQFGAIVEGPLIGLLLTWAGWDWVLASLVSVSAFGTLVLYQVFKQHESMKI